MIGSAVARHRLAACLHADICEYSRLIADDVETTVRMVNLYRAMMRGVVLAHGGWVIDMSGDSVLAEFPSVGGAVRAAVEIQRELASRNAGLPVDRRIEFRVGIEVGDVLVDDGRIYGDCVNVAARVQEVAAPGGICLGGSAFDHVDRSLSERFTHLGERRVKNIRKPQRIYRLASA
jgi:adenylate cyclase